MRPLRICLLGAFLVSLSVGHPMEAREQSDGSVSSSRTLRPVIRGTQYAVSSMKLRRRRPRRASWKRAATPSTPSWRARPCWRSSTPRVERVRRRCGRSGLRRPREEGPLDQRRRNRPQARDHRVVQQEQRRPDPEQRRAALGVASRRHRCLVHHARPLGHDDVRAGSRARIDVAENGFPIGEGLSRAIAGSRKIQKYPSTMRVYFPERPSAAAWRAVPESRLGADAPQAGRSRKGRGRQGPARGAERRARSLLQRRHRQEMADSPRKTAASFATRISRATRPRSRRRSRRLSRL